MILSHKLGRPPGSGRLPEGHQMLKRRGEWMFVHPTGDATKILVKGTRATCEAWLKQKYLREDYQNGHYVIAVWKVKQIKAREVEQSPLDPRDL